jgi:hypothetical protein
MTESDRPILEKKKIPKKCRLAELDGVGLDLPRRDKAAPPPPPRRSLDSTVPQCRGGGGIRGVSFTKYNGLDMLVY